MGRMKIDNIYINLVPSTIVECTDVDVFKYNILLDISKEHFFYTAER